MLRRFDRQVVLLGVLDGNVAGQGKIAHRGDAVHVGGHRSDGDLEADLVVTLAGAAVGDGGGTEFAGGLDQVLGDDGARQRGNERVLAFVERVGLQGRHAVFACKFVAGVGDVSLDSSTVERTLADDLEVLAALADVDGDGHDFAAGLLSDPSDGDRGVQAA